MKVVFMGTPEVAVPVLEAIYNSRHKVVAVVSQPDKAKGRSNKIVPTPVKQVALNHGTMVYQFESIKKDDISSLLNLDADIIVTCAYGQILKENVLNAFKHGVINVHFSRLPKYRGASPVQSALIGCEKSTAVTVLKSQIGMDDGDIIDIADYEISNEENAISLFENLSKVGANLITKVLDDIENGTAKYIPQESTNIPPSYCTMLKPEMGDLDFGSTADKIVGLIKGLAMWPNAHITIDDVYFKLYNAISYMDISINPYLKGLNVNDYQNGEVVIASNKQGLYIKCGDGFVEITELLPINGKKMTAKSYLNGKKINVGSIAK